MRVSKGFFTVEHGCNACGGRGETIDKPCRDCHGQGRVRKMRTLKVDIPKGVDEGSRVRLTGEGEAGVQGGPAGDLYIFISLFHHPFFERKDKDIYCKIPVSIVDTSLGGEIDVPTLDGTKARIKVPAGTQHGVQLRLREKGMSQLRTQARGDMYVQIEVETPVNLTPKQRELLQQFANEGGQDKLHFPARERFLGKVKEFWKDLTQ